MELDKLWNFLRNRVVITLFLIFVLLSTVVLVWPFCSRGIERIQRRHYGIPSEVYLGDLNIGGYYLFEVEELLISESSKIVRWPTPAKIDHKGVITQEIWGRILDLSATMERVENAQEGEYVTPVFASIYPSLLTQEILTLSNTLGVFHTYIGGTEERLQNIKLAGSLVNFTLLMPDQVFSFNSTVGEPSKQRGFQEAPIIVGEEIVPGYGGGICQVSSTLYNAVLKAKLKIIERYSHSKKVSYVPAGQDATVAYDYLDFKFVNSQDNPILVRVWVWGRRLQIGLYGPEK